MNKILSIVAALATCFATYAQDKGDKDMLTENKPLVAYFSATGTTA